MSDGPAPAESTYRPLNGKPIAIIIVAVAVNKGVGLRDLTAADIQRMYNGTYTNWSQLKGTDLPIRLIGREFGSGTRRAFDADVLGGTRRHRVHPRHARHRAGGRRVGQHRRRRPAGRAQRAQPGLWGYRAIGE